MSSALGTSTLGIEDWAVGLMKRLPLVPVPGITPRYRNATRRATAAGSSSFRWIEFSSASLKPPFKALSK